jgi:hypothetical protein
MPVARTAGVMVLAAFDEAVFEDLTRLVYLTGNTGNTTHADFVEYEDLGSGP